MCITITLDPAYPVIECCYIQPRPAECAAHGHIVPRQFLKNQVLQAVLTMRIMIFVNFTHISQDFLHILKAVFKECPGRFQDSAPLVVSGKFIFRITVNVNQVMCSRHSVTLICKLLVE